MEEWLQPIQTGDIVRRETILNEIKNNLIAVISDYQDRPPFNEAQLIQDAEQLFQGDVVPSRDDWRRLERLLSELATVKEQGQMYQYFIRDVSDSLGVSDLEQIKAFIDYIQTLPPEIPGVNIQLGLPKMYTISSLTHKNLGEWSKVELNWGLSDNYLEKPVGYITNNSSPSEDIVTNLLHIEAGNYQETFDPQKIDGFTQAVTLDWLNWFNASALTRTWLRAKVEVIDKRGNTSIASEQINYPSSVRIPRGVRRYHVQSRKDGGNWLDIGRTTATRFEWSPPRQNGNYQWRVRAEDHNGTYTPWVLTPIQFIRFIPDPPSTPKVSVSTDLNEATVTWTAAARADYYEIWHGGESAAKDKTKNGNVYWGRVEADKTRRFVSKGLAQGKTYTWYVRAVNEGGTSIGKKSGTMKRKVIKSKTYRPTKYRVWRGAYDFKNRWGSITRNTSSWRSTNRLYQGGWREIVRSHNPYYPGWDARGGGTYYAWGNQQWGNHMSFAFFDYNSMRNLLRNKDIKKVTITVSRAATTKGEKHHGWPNAKPLYLYNHNYDASVKTPSSFPFYRADGGNVKNNTQDSLANVTFSRGETEVIANWKTKRLIQNIVDGKMKGLGIVRYYGNYFNSDLDVGDKAYMVMDQDIDIKVEYYEIQ